MYDWLGNSVCKWCRSKWIWWEVTVKNTWCLSEICETVLLQSPSASVPPAPYCLSAAPLSNGRGPSSPTPRASVKKQELSRRAAADSYCTYASNGVVGPTWSLNMRKIISSTCMLHCCSLGEDARNLIRSSKPVLCMAHSSRSWTLASPSTFCRRDGLRERRWQDKCVKERASFSWSVYNRTSLASHMVPVALTINAYLLFTGICRYMKQVPGEEKDPLNQKEILFLSLLPVLKKVSDEWHNERHPY